MGVKVLGVLLMVAVAFMAGISVPDDNEVVTNLKSEVADLKKKLRIRVGGKDADQTKKIKNLESERDSALAAHKALDQQYRDLEAKLAQLKKPPGVAETLIATDPEVEKPGTSKISPVMSAVLKGKYDTTLALIEELEQGKGNNMQLGMKLVGLVNQFSADDFKVLMAAQEATDDEAQREDISRLLMNSAVFNPLAMKKTLPGFMDQVITRMENDEGYSDDFRTGIWFRMSYKQGPANAYNGVVSPLDRESKERLYTLASNDLQNDNYVRKLGAAMYLGRTKDARASASLWDIARSGDKPQLLSVALDALSQIPSQENLENFKALRDESTDAVRKAQYDKLVKDMEAELEKLN